ncbi:MAG: carbohydrate ABC transporter permease [Bacillota bacterium]
MNCQKKNNDPYKKKVIMDKITDALIYNFILSFTLFCLIPFLLVISGSLTNDTVIIREGYSLIPKQLDVTAYKLLLMDINKILRGYAISIFVTVTGTLASLLINAMVAYPISLSFIKYRKVVSVYALITILFNSGMVTWYIVCVRYLHLKDSLMALILPYLANAWYIFLLRNYFQTIPGEMHESALIDGAGEFRIFFKIIIPLSKPVLATVALFVALMYWNDWWLGIMLIDNEKLKPLQLLLRTIVSNVQYLQSSPNAAQMRQLIKSLPTESVKMAVCVITIGPILFLYPFIQRYFVKGIMMGAVKG